MTLPLSTRILRMGDSATLKLAKRSQELREQGKDVLSFGLGEPDFDTPAGAREAAKAAIDRGETHYTANEGILSLRQAVARTLHDEIGLDYDPKKQILITNGSKQAIAQALLSIVNVGDDVIIPSPYWVTYPELVKFAGGNPVYVPCPADQRFHLDAKALEAACTDRTRVLLLNSPNNPSGAVLSQDELAAIADVVVRHKLVVVSDEIYGCLVYGDRKHHSPAASLPAMRERTIVCSGVSKAYAMTGWRIGYAAGPVEVIAAMNRLQGHLTSNPCSIAQHAAVAAFNECRGAVPPMREEFDKRRRLVVGHLSKLPGVRLPEPEGAFYAFADVGRLFGKTTSKGVVVSDSTTFCEAMLDEVLVSVVPGAAFGDDTCFRLSYAASQKTLEEGCARIAKFIGGLK